MNQRSGFLRNFVKKATICSVVYPTLTWAIGLGHIQVHSTLNQPFSADIPILDVGKTPLTTIQAKLANGEEYAKVGLEPTPYANTLQFIVHHDEHKQPSVHISTDTPIDDPVFSILLSISAPEGQLLREYTVFLDPPNYTNKVTVAPILNSVENLAPPAPFTDIVKPEHQHVYENHFLSVQSAEDNQNHPITEAIKPTSIPTTENISHVSKPTPSNKTSKAIPRTYYVKANESLWSIAGKVKPAGTTREQVISALVEENPRAFINNDPNKLMKDAVLTIPTREEIQRITTVTSTKATEPIIAEPQQAKTPTKQVALNEPVKTMDKQTEQQPEKQIEQTVNVEATPIHQAETSPQPQSPETVILSNTHLNGSEQNNISNQPDDSAKEIKQLRAELAVAIEALNNSRQSNSLLNEKLLELQQQNQQLQAAMVNTSTQPTQSVDHTQPTPSQPQQPAQMTPTLETQNVEKTLIKESNQGGGWMQRLIGILLLLISIPVLLWVYLRRKEITIMPSFVEKLKPHARVTMMENDETVEPKPHPKIVPMEHLVNERAGQKIQEKTPSVTEQPLPNQPSPVNNIHPPLSSAHPDIDILEEVDVYMAYGRYEQAINVLQHSIELYPNRLDLKEKMLEVYLAAKDKEAFKKILATLPTDLQSRAPELHNKIVILQKQNEQQADAEISTPTPTPTPKSVPTPLQPELSEQQKVVSSENQNPSNVMEFELYSEDSHESARVDATTKPQTTSQENSLEFSFDNNDIQNPGSDIRNNDTDDVIETKFDLAKVYIDMADYKEARSLLEEIIKNGSDDQKQRAQEIIKSLQNG